ncbi:peptidase S15 [Roseobacter cerasinus]|uniref:Peptidase S15 n=1 Tax=Roseobacter cerasinus TaxID=2602289 RepID=A0A640VQM9_9RHOB|nr:CocE/NonD family hydrolase [Roseobacter cerasinus]GFE48516.1 peptidase S15 [Roseobacter cerasinus]
MNTTLQDIEDLPDYGITLSDGTRLSARIWRPVDAAEHPVPVILEYLPYRRRDGTAARDALTHPWFAERGYACVRVDMRGTGDSDGRLEDEYTTRELSDALEVVTQLAAAPWCSGSIGMMGIGWGGFNSLQVAARAPEPLKAVITLCSTVDRFADDIHYKGGCLLNENLGWGAAMWSYSSRPPDPALRSDWREIWLQRLEQDPFLPGIWLRHQHRDTYWRHGSVCEDYDAITAKVLAIGGWGDAYKNAVPQLVQALPGAKGIVGPWAQDYPHLATPDPRIGFLQEALRWWDRWLRDEGTDVEDDPDFRAYMMDAVRPARSYTERPGRWVAEADGATHHIPHRTLYLNRHGLTDGRGTITTPICSPQDTGAEAGEYCAIWGGPDMPGDQREDDAKSACFDTAPADQDTDIFGAPKVRLRLSSDQPQAQIAVRLCDVHPDGASTRITYGALNLSHREDPADPAPMPTDTPMPVELWLDTIAYRLPKGHKLRLSVSTAYWPLIWPAPQSGTITLQGGSLHLPVRRTARREEVNLPPPEAAPPPQAEALRATGNSRTREVDMATGIVTLRIKDDFGKTRDLDHGLISGSAAQETWSIHPDDPLSAHGACRWTQELERDDIRLRTEASCEMWSDATHFHLSARLEAYENDRLIYERDLTDSVARDHI